MIHYCVLKIYKKKKLDSENNGFHLFHHAEYT